GAADLKCDAFLTKLSSGRMVKWVPGRRGQAHSVSPHSEVDAMRRLSIGLACLLALALVLGYSAQATAQQKGKQKGRGPSGAITKVDLKDGVGTITVKVTPRVKKGETAPEGKDTTFKITKDTKIQKSAGKKGEPPTDAQASDLQEGTRVTVVLAEDSQD